MSWTVDQVKSFPGIVKSEFSVTDFLSIWFNLAWAPILTNTPSYALLGFFFGLSADFLANFLGLHSHLWQSDEWIPMLFFSFYSNFGAGVLITCRYTTAYAIVSTPFFFYELQPSRPDGQQGSRASFLVQLRCKRASPSFGRFAPATFGLLSTTFKCCGLWPTCVGHSRQRRPGNNLTGFPRQVDLPSL